MGNNISHYLDLIRNGDVFYNERIKFSVIMYATALLHGAYSILFFITGVRTLGIYNALVLIGYYFLNTLIKKKKYLLVVILANLEVVFFSLSSTIFLGKECGFQYVIIGMIPVVFYLAVAWNCFKRRELSCMLYSVYFLVAFLIGSIAPDFVKPAIEVKPWQIYTFYYYNIAVMFGTSVGFLYMFVWDIGHKNKMLLKQNDRLDQMANRDALTGAYNRRFIDQKIEEKLKTLSESGKIFCLIMGDVDDFKKVNDTYGHESGDDVLKAISHCMVDALRGTDYVCRWGGEEFLIIVDGNGKIGRDLAERMRVKIENLRIETHGYTISVSMTFGVSESLPGLSADKLVQIADDNLYKGKKNGKNQVN